MSSPYFGRSVDHSPFTTPGSIHQCLQHAQNWRRSAKLQNDLQGRRGVSILIRFRSLDSPGPSPRPENAFGPAVVWVPTTDWAFNSACLPICSTDLAKGGQDFLLPVDGEHKSTVFPLLKLSTIHVRSFHAAWLALFSSYFAALAPAALAPVIRDNLDLTTADLNRGTIAAIVGSIASHIAMGAICDTLGPRLCHGCVLMLTAPAVFGISLASTTGGFVITRFFAGFSLATFVQCQFWTSVMFGVRIVGRVNGYAAGLGQAGGAVSHLIMPLLLRAIERYQPSYVAWRYALWVPAALQVVIGVVVLLIAQDLPDGTYARLEAKSQLQTPGIRSAYSAGISNYRTWVLSLLYACSYGVEVVMQNAALSMFFDNYAMGLDRAGLYASLFGLSSVIVRGIGGHVSDWFSGHAGMKGRLWWLWGIQVLEGLVCVALGAVCKARVLALSVVFITLLSVTVQAAEGACFGVVPFVSKRALGTVIGVVGAGGNAGALAFQGMFFSSERLDTSDGIILLGLTLLVMSGATLLVYFPMWGGLCFLKKEGTTEEEYYLSEFTEQEIAQGFAHSSLLFAVEARAERGAELAGAELELARQDSEEQYSEDGGQQRYVPRTAGSYTAGGSGAVAEHD